MNTENQETIADIITEARGVFDELRKHGYNVVSVDRMADIIDRVEEAHKREREDGAEAAQICGEIGEMVGRAASKNHSVTNCNRLGNAETMREELINAYYAMFKFIKTPYDEYEEMSIALDAARAALDEPPRNCDVGTPEEQHRRFKKWCRQARCVSGCIRGMAEWLQLQYVRELQTTGEVVK